MDTKLLLQSPHKAIELHWGHIDQCSAADEILTLATCLKMTIAEIREVKLRKNLCAKSFKEASGDAVSITSLKVQMQGISKELGHLSSEQKKQEALLNTLFSKGGSKITTIQPSPALPSQFDTNTEEESALGPITYVEWGDKPPADWDSYVSKQTNASLYHRYNWRDVITQSFGHQSHYFAAVDERNIVVGVFPTTRLTSRLFGDFAVSLPYFNYGGVLANNTAISQGIIDFAALYYKKLGVSHLEVRSTDPQLCSWPTNTDKVSMIRTLPEDTGELARELGAKIRSQIKRAKKEHPEVMIGGMELLEQFYRVFSINMRDLGTPVYSRLFFANILKQSSESATIVLIKINSQPVAAALLLSHGEMLEIPWASTLKQVNSMSINMLLYWEVLSFAIRRRHKFFDFGRSTKNANTFRFKKQWGAKPVQHHWYYWLNDSAALPNLKPDNPSFAIAIRVWKLLPVSIANILGPQLVKNLP
jgi:serine/alanine adding enzyme